MALAGLKAMLAGAVQDRLAAAGALLVAAVLVGTAWVLAIAALVVFLSAHLGTIWALLAVAAGMVVLALLIVWLTTARNRRTADLRKTTRALWAATAVNAASAVLRGQPQGQTADAEAGGGSHRSALLMVGGLALMLLALLMPGSHETGPRGSDPGPGDDV